MSLAQPERDIAMESTQNTVLLVCIPILQADLLSGLVCLEVQSLKLNPQPQVLYIELQIDKQIGT